MTEEEFAACLTMFRVMSDLYNTLSNFISDLICNRDDFICNQSTYASILFWFLFISFIVVPPLLLDRLMNLYSSYGSNKQSSEKISPKCSKCENKIENNARNSRKK